MATVAFDVWWRDHGAKAGFKGLSAEARQAAKAQDEFKARAMVAGAVVGAGLFKLGKDAIATASDIGESQSKVRVVFGRSAVAVEKLADTSAKSFGISKAAALEAAGTFGNLFVSLKLPQGEAAKMSTRMVQLAADMASFNNTSPEDALEALRSGLVGETEPLRRFGVNIQDAQLRQEALKLGLISTTKDALSPAVKAQASYALILEQTKTAQGDFARTSGGLANQQRILKAEFSDLEGELGAKLLPAVVATTREVVGFVGFVDQHGKAFGIAATAVGGFATAVWTVNKASAAFKATSQAWDTLSGAVGRFNGKAGSAKGAMLGIGGAGGALGILGGALAVGGIAWGLYAEHQREAATRASRLRDALDEQTGALKDNAREAAFKNLQDLGAVEAAKRLGISLKDVTDAALGDAAAQKRVSEALAKAKEETAGLAVTTGRGSHAYQTFSGDINRVSSAIGDQNTELAKQRQKLNDARAAGVGMSDSQRELAKRMNDSATAANSFERRLAGIHDKTVTVGAVLSFPKGWAQYRAGERRAAFGGAIGDGVGTVDDVPALLMRGEHVWTTREVSAAGGHASVARMRRAALAGGLKGYAAGGPVGLTTAAAAAAGDHLEAVMEDLAVQFGRSLQKQIGGGIGGGSLGGIGWARQWAAVHAAFPSAVLYSAFRRGAVTASGNTSYHALGRAIDVTPSMAIFDWLRSNYGARTKELIYSPAGSRQLKNGAPHLYGEPVRGMHWNHVHFAYDQGGVARGAGWIPKRTAAPERVLSPQQTRDFADLVRVLDAGGGAVTVVQNFNAPNYVGSRQDLIRALSDAGRTGQLAGVLRAAGVKA